MATIPISNVTRRAVYAPSGAGGVGPYAFTFEILANTDIAVYKDDTLLTLTTHYSVTINGNGTGSVLINATGLALAPASPTQYAIVGNRTIARATDFTTGGDFFANTLNDELDQQTIFAQQNAEGLNRALQAPQTDPTTINMTLPAKATRANKTLTFDANGNPSAGVSAADVANAVTYAANAAASATASAVSAAAAASSASAASGSASTATTQATNASSSASSATSSASSAGSSASTAGTQAAAASASASNAAASASTATTQATNAATSASGASTSATNAAASAATATTQASNASTSASNASTSATNAANSAAAAASALDSFDDRYLGTKTSDPTLDNDGNALVSGALYFSTTQNVMKVYDGASWITATSAGATSLLRFRYVATSGQTTFSGADSASATLTYTVNNIAVHRNGVTLDTSEYTASNGTSIVLTVAAGTGDIIDIIAFKSFTVADALSAVSGGTVNGAVTVTGALTTTGNTILGDATSDTLTVGVTGIVKDASGNVGIGTASPSTSNTAGASFVPGTSTVASMTGSNGSGQLLLGNNGNGSNLATNDSCGMIAFKGRFNSTFGGGNDIASIIGTYTGNGTTRSGAIRFLTLDSGTEAERARIDSSGNLLVGKTAVAASTIGFEARTTGFVASTMAASTNATDTLNVYSTGASVYRFYVGMAGTVFATNTAITAISDIRLKENIRDLDDGLQKVMALQPRKFDWKEGKGADIKDARGFIAQEFEIVFPDMVEEWKDTPPEGEEPYKAVNANLIPTLVKAIQEQQALIQSLTTRITALEGA